MTDEVTSTCERCGASIYKQHIDTGIARYEDGKLMCSHCVAEFERKHDSAVGGLHSEDFAPIALDDNEPGGASDSASDSASGSATASAAASAAASASGGTRIHGFSTETLGAHGGWSEHRFKRPVSPTGVGASRCRLFHTKLTEGALDFLTNSINEWLDEHPDITIKNSSSTVGPFEGKHTEPNLIVTVFY